MSKYARAVDHGDSIRLQDVVEIPSPLPPWANDAEAFLSKMFEPHKEEWENAGTWFFLVADDAQAGAVKQQDGTYLNPPTVNRSIPWVLTKTAFQDLAWTAFGGGATGMARFNAIMTACKTGSDLLQAIYDRYDAAVTFSKDQVSALTQIMVGATVMTSDERSAVLSAWPEDQP